MQGNMKPTSGNLDAPMKCVTPGCGWRGLLSAAIRCAVNPTTGSYIAMCPKCREFKLRTVA